MSFLALQIGSLRIALDLGRRPRAETDSIRRRYGSFFTRSDADYVLQCLPGLDGRIRIPQVRADGAELRCTSGRFEWRLDLKKGRGSARWTGREQDLDSLLRTLAASLLPRHGGLLLHAAAFRWKGRAHLFAGRSGAGKTTLARRLEEVPGLRRLSDELVVLERHGIRYRLSASPFWGEFGLPQNNGSAPLGNLFLLEKAASGVRVTPVAPAQAQRRLLQCWVSFERTPEIFGRSWDMLVDAAVRHPAAELRWDKTHDSTALARALWTVASRRVSPIDDSNPSTKREALNA